MASVPTIPAHIRAAFQTIAELPGETFQELVSVFESLPLRIRQTFTFDDANLDTKSISPEIVSRVKEAIFPLYNALASGAVTVDLYVVQIADSLKESKGEGVAWTQSTDTLTHFKERLRRLLSIQTLHTVAKAHDVLLANGQNFSSARILTDARPVFLGDVDKPPTEAVIVHMLHIDYYENDVRKNFAVTLDTKDVEILMDTLKRAQKKAESLQSAIASSDMTYIPVV